MRILLTMTIAALFILAPHAEAAESFFIKDANGDNLLEFRDNGSLTMFQGEVIKHATPEQLKPRDPTPMPEDTDEDAGGIDEWIIHSENGVIARLDYNNGNLYIKGNHVHGFFAFPGLFNSLAEFRLYNSSGSIKVSIDEGGHLTHKGSYSKASRVWPDRMLALGDSGSRGTMSDPSQLGWNAVAAFFDFLIFEDPPPLETAFDQVLHNWSTGFDLLDDVSSHWEKILINNPSIQPHNFAVSGSKFAQMNNQASAANEAFPSATFDYVTIMIGGNDICKKFIAYEDDDLAALRTQFTAAIVEIRSQSPDATIIAIEMPDFTLLNNASKLFGFDHRLQCFLIHFISGLCPIIMGDVSGNKELAREHIVKLNTIMRQVSQENGVEFIDTIFEQFPAEIINLFAGPLQDISVDCFHPTKQALDKLSTLTWDPSLFRN